MDIANGRRIRFLHDKVSWFGRYLKESFPYCIALSRRKDGLVDLARFGTIEGLAVNWDLHFEG